MPIGDIHLGAKACDEDRLQRVIDRVRRGENAYWIGMGDFADFINVSDRRFSPTTLAEWIRVSDLGDLARVQRDRFLDYVTPIADKCLALIMGNHEQAIHKHYERAIYSEIVTGIKERAGMDAQEKLGLGYSGWLQLAFYRAAEERRGASIIDIHLHHGFVGGKLAGAKALNMQRWLWTHDCDVAIFGHSHNTSSQVEAVEEIDSAGNVRVRKRVGAYGGTFLRTNVEGSTTYSETKGYFPLPMSGAEILLRPGASHINDRVRVVTGT